MFCLHEDSIPPNQELEGIQDLVEIKIYVWKKKK